MKNILVFIVNKLIRTFVRTIYQIIKTYIHTNINALKQLFLPNLKKTGLSLK